MSKESARQFVNRMQGDEGFAGEVEKLGSKEERATFIKQKGFDFTKGELMDAALELNALDVVGGKCCGMTCENDSGCSQEPYCRPV
jgi:predicted ribosomally synthesized peptide with nif11-like leader